MASIATLNIDIKASAGGFVTGINRAQTSLGVFQKGLNAGTVALGNFAAAMAQRAVAAIQDFAVQSIQVASDARETRNKFRAVFQDMADDVEKFVKESSESIGRSKTELRDALSSFQGFFVGLGFGKQRAAGFSKELTSLALDFASFNNLTDDEAFSRFISALSGSSEVLDRFGINIKAAALDAEFLRQGIDATTRTATEQQKTLARLSIIRRAMGDQGAIGDAKKTANEFAGLQKQLASAFQEFQVGIGEALLPLLQDALPAMTKFLREAGPDLGELASQLVDLVGGVTSLNDALGDLARRIGELRDLSKGELPQTLDEVTALVAGGDRAKRIGTELGEALGKGQLGRALEKGISGLLFGSTIATDVREAFQTEDLLFGQAEQLANKFKMGRLPEPEKAVVPAGELFWNDAERDFIGIVNEAAAAQRAAAGKIADNFAEEVQKALRPTLRQRVENGLFALGEVLGRAPQDLMRAIGEPLGKGLTEIGKEQIAEGFGGFGVDPSQAGRNIERARFAALSRATGPNKVDQQQLETSRGILRETKEVVRSLKDIVIESIASFR